MVWSAALTKTGFGVPDNVEQKYEMINFYPRPSDTSRKLLKSQKKNYNE